jgi:hypothetical protein
VKVLAVIGIVVLLAIGIGSFGGSNSVNRPILEHCETGAGARFMEIARETGVLVRRSGTSFYVEESDWNAMEYNLKVTFAVSAYCEVRDPDGLGYAAVRGNRSGEILSHVVNGHHFRD